MKSYKLTPLFLFSLLFLTTACNEQQEVEKEAVHPRYAIGSPVYEEIAETALRHIENFEFAEFGSLLSDDIEYYLPDGDAGTRTSFIGKEAVMGFWNSFQETSGNDRMVAKDIVHVPIVSKDELVYSKVQGNLVMSYFSLELGFGEEQANVRCHWAFGFDDQKKINKIYSYYDRTPIIEAAQRNILAKQ